MYYYVDDVYVYDNANTWETDRHMREAYIERYAKAGHEVRLVDGYTGEDETYGPWNDKPYREIAPNENWGFRPFDEEGYRQD